MSSSSRRDFLRTGMVAGAALTSISARTSRAATRGPNDTIRIGSIGFGSRGTWHANWLKKVSDRQKVALVAVSDIWNNHRDHAVGTVKNLFGAEPKIHHDYRELLDRNDIDAVVIATPDHQHCGMLIDAVKAGKDAYIEKPIAMNIDELNRAYDAVKAAKAVVQHGTQGRSCAGAASARDFVQSGKLGKILRIEESRSFYNPYWNFYPPVEKEGDTDWKAFLYNLPMRPFDGEACGGWMGYRDFSTGTVGGWMSHLCDFIHFVTGAKCPKYAVAHGGIYSPTSKKGRDCPDTFNAILDYSEGFTVSYWTHFGNGDNDYIKWFGTKGTMQTGAPDGWPDGIAPKVSGSGSEHPEKIKEAVALENNVVQDHMENWLECIRTRKAPAADMEAGYRHGVAVVLADRAYVEGRKMMFDEARRTIVPAPATPPQPRA